MEFRCHLKVQNSGPTGLYAGVFPHAPIGCHWKSLWFYRCSVLFVFVLCSTEVYVYTKKSTSKVVFKNDPNYCLFSECVLVPFLFKKIVSHFIKNSSMEIEIIWRCYEGPDLRKWESLTTSFASFFFVCNSDVFLYSVLHSCLFNMAFKAVNGHWAFSES